MKCFLIAIVEEKDLKKELFRTKESKGSIIWEFNDITLGHENNSNLWEIKGCPTKTLIVKGYPEKFNNSFLRRIRKILEKNMLK